jgi:hypothetical protein
VALRLFVSQANAPETHASLAAFATALAYFGKSDRAGLIRAIHARYMATAAAPATPAVARPSTPDPPASAPPAARHAAATAFARRGLAIAAIVAAIVIAVAAVLKLLPRITRSDAASPASAQAATPAAAQKAARPRASKATSAADAKPQATPAHTNQPAATELTTPARREAFLPISRSGRVQSPPTISAPRQELPREPASAVSLVDVAGPVTSTPPQPGTTRTLTDRGSDAIYSREDADVQPPVMLYPQLPPPLVIGVPSDGFVNHMELVVAPDGSVERVHLVGVPRRLPDMMLLSGAKLWRFAPAVRNGEPVRYRTIISWAAFP